MKVGSSNVENSQQKQKGNKHALGWRLSEKQVDRELTQTASMNHTRDLLCMTSYFRL